MSVKSSTLTRLAKWCQSGSWLLRTNFKHSRVQITFTMTLSKNYHNNDESRSHPNVISCRWLYTQKTKMKTLNTIASSCHLKVSEVYSRQGSPIFALFGSWSLALYLHFWVNSKNFSHNCILTILVDVQSFHKSDMFLTRFILCFKKRFCCSTLLY